LHRKGESGGKGLLISPLPRGGPPESVQKLINENTMKHKHPPRVLTRLTVRVEHNMSDLGPTKTIKCKKKKYIFFYLGQLSRTNKNLLFSNKYTLFWIELNKQKV